MNILGHNYVAWKVIGRLNELTVAGSEIPDIVPFVADSILTFEEIHESGEDLLDYLDKNCPEKRDLALAIMCHSVKFGADAFNREIDAWLIGENETLKKSLAAKIADCADIPFEVAYHNRMHNYLWVGVDIYLMKNELTFAQQIRTSLETINVEEMAKVLSEWAGKPKGIVQANINRRLDTYRHKDFSTPLGYARSLKEFHAGLPEKDTVDPEKSILLFEEIYQKFEGKWEGILQDVTANVREKMTSYL